MSRPGELDPPGAGHRGSGPRVSHCFEQLLDALARPGVRFSFTQRFELCLQASFEFHPREAALAGIQMLLHRVAALALEFMIDELEDVLERLLAIDRPYRFQASLPEWLSAAAVVNPYACALCQRIFCSAPRARASRERTVPIGMPRDSAISA